MGQRGEIYSTRIFIDEGQKTFFFNVKENRFHDRYINIVESRKTDNGFKRASLVVFDDDIGKFLRALEEAMATIRARRPLADTVLNVGGGRREYLFRFPPRGKPALQVYETREDATGSRRESIVVPVPSFDLFSENLKKAVGILKNP